MVGDANWHLVDNGTVAEATEGKGGFLVTPRDYGDFEITVEGARHFVGAKVVRTPFFNPPRKTATPPG
jgi:hypothetical protein